MSIKHNQENLDHSGHLTEAMVIRGMRALIGISQIELANELGIAKTTIARLETLDGKMKPQQFTQVLEYFSNRGVTYSVNSENGLTISVSAEAFQSFLLRIGDTSNRRADLKKQPKAEYYRTTYLKSFPE